MASFQGMRYAELLAQILNAAEERLGIQAKLQAAAASQMPAAARIG